ncbi:hypothetical protein ACJIZ3_015294 [Penstemon smallii]|uniref:Uncharacterized protein n=1 Tax=Penstemon smallii TaxID=265156 RepID=A0ABD3RQ45_9LAMI
MGSSALAKLPIVHHTKYAMWQKWHLLPDKNLHYRVVGNDFYAMSSSSSLLLPFFHSS